jgi:hypothetical protein
VDGKVVLLSSVKTELADWVQRNATPNRGRSVRSGGCISRKRAASGARSEFRRTPQTARSRRLREDSESFLTVTHPFHPLTGQRLRVLFERHYKATGLSLCCEGGPAGTVMLPVAWTDRGKPVAPQALGYEELLELAELVRALTTRRQD